MGAYLSLCGRGRGGRLFEAGRLLTFFTFRIGVYSRWALIRGWALIRINNSKQSPFSSGLKSFGVIECSMGSRRYKSGKALTKKKERRWKE